MKSVTKIVSLVLAFVMLCSVLGGCGVIKGDTVMEYEGYEITEAMYSYWKSHFKAAFIDGYGTAGADGKKKVDWQQTLPNGQTYEQFFENELVNPYAKKVLICQKLFDDYKLSFTDEHEQAVEDILSGLESIYGGSKGLNAYLAPYGLNEKTLERIYYAEAKVAIVSDYIFAISGPKEITAAERAAYYEANYFCINWIYIYTEKKPAPASEGTTSSGNYIMVDMSDTEKAQKNALVDEIVEKLNNGESFSTLKHVHCEDKYEDGTSKYDYLPNGFNVCANDYGNYGADLIKLVQGMEIGEVATSKDGYGGTRIVVRNPLTEFKDLTDQERSVMVDFETYVREDKWDRIIADAKITVYTEVADRYKVADVVPFTNLVI